MEELRALRERAEGLRTVGVTGTNGKSTTTALLAAIIAAHGEVAPHMTTLGGFVGQTPIDATLPDGAAAPPQSHAMFVATVEAALSVGARTFALEVTSHALARDAAERWPVDVAVFTNLSRDHLDAHGSAEAYLAAKAQLFRFLPPEGVAVLNRDDPASALLREVLPPGCQVFDYSLADPAATLSAARVEVHLGHTTVELAAGPLAALLGGTLRLRLTGAVHAANALAAALAGHALGYPGAAIRAGCEAFAGVPGRFEQVFGPRADAPSVVVDYAHTPDGLAGTLRTARATRPSERGRVICVFGCGGERDRGKRPQMARVADALADRVIVTDDNPRGEDPAVIVAEILGGLDAGPSSRWEVIHDRRRAIARGIALGTEQDIVVIAGRGHETAQQVGGEVRRCCDRELARAALAAWKGRPET